MKMRQGQLTIEEVARAIFLQAYDGEREPEDFPLDYIAIESAYRAGLRDGAKIGTEEDK